MKAALYITYFMVFVLLSSCAGMYCPTYSHSTSKGTQNLSKPKNENTGAVFGGGF